MLASGVLVGGGGVNIFSGHKKRVKKFSGLTSVQLRFKTNFCRQILVKTCLKPFFLDLGLENFFSHHYLYEKTFQIIFFILQIWGPPLHCTSDRPCKLKSLCTNFFFKLFWCTNFFSFCFPCSIFIFALSLPPPPSLF
jgi:hypothetical protein